MAASAQPSEKSDGLVFHPMDQFIVEPLFGSGPIHWYTVTNVTLWMGLSVVALVLVMLVGTSKRAHRSEEHTSETPVTSRSRMPSSA